MAASGAGKTTLCYALTGIIPHVFTVPYGKERQHIKGDIKLFGQTLTKVETVTDPKTGKLFDKIVGMKQTAPRVGLLLQDPENQFLRMDLLHEICFGMELLGLCHPPSARWRRSWTACLQSRCLPDEGQAQQDCLHRQGSQFAREGAPVLPAGGRRYPRLCPAARRPGGRHRNRGDGQRERGPAARRQSHQAASAVLQRQAYRRQELPGLAP